MTSLVINRDLILKPLTLTTGFIEKKHTMPILSNVYIKKQQNEITLVANDMEIQISITVSGEMEGDDFIITVPAKKLHDILKAFSDNSQVTMLQHEQKINLHSGNTKFTIHSMPADHYPLLKVTDSPINQFTIPQQDLKKLLSQTQYAMADKDSRTFLNGMLFEIKDNQLNLIATDAHRLGLVSYKLAENLHNSSIIVPRKTVLELYRLLDDSQEPITIRIYPHQICFMSASIQLITKVIDGKYPDYERVIPLGNDKLCLVNREQFLRAIDRVSVIGIDKLKSISLTISHNLLKLTCHNEDQEHSHDEIEIIYPHEDLLNVSFNISYIRDVLINTHADHLQWAFYDGQRSVLITIPNELDFKAVVMPLRA